MLSLHGDPHKKTAEGRDTPVSVPRISPIRSGCNKLTVGYLHRDASKKSQVSTLLIAMFSPAQHFIVSETPLISDACVL